MAGERRAPLLSSIERAMTEAQGQGTIFGNAVAERLGLSSTELETLGLLQVRGPLSAGAISRSTGLTTGAVTRMVDRLVSTGWVTRRENPQDRRGVLIELTSGARKKSAPFYGPMARATREVLASYSEKELELMLGLLTRLRDVGIAETERIMAMPERVSGTRKVNIKARVLGQKIRIRF
ncbi:MAG: hypothetical protein AUH72_07780 [Acidobacteria bacterium 13_1_40CM_4_65_8]|nr:MAG: hypothetical protein AUH72_07780 [Acidobacteria bacterium 13_1_40CM_4_65_8]